MEKECYFIPLVQRTCSDKADFMQRPERHEEVREEESFLVREWEVQRPWGQAGVCLACHGTNSRKT